MSQQPSRDGIAEPPGRTDGLFFAIVPSPEAAAQIEERARAFHAELGLKGRPLATEHFHITLYYLGAHAGVPQGIFAKASETAAAVHMAPFEITVDLAMSFSGKSHSRPLVLCSSKPLAGLNTFQLALSAAIRKAGLVHWVQPSFIPHVTLLYDGRRVPKQAVEPIRWTAREFVLVRSHLGLSRHETLARWPLPG
jgi:2'-5' RNA ligase